MNVGVGKISRDLWIEIAKKRILSILDARKITYNAHLMSKIAEAGPNNQRAEPHILNEAIRELKRGQAIIPYTPTLGFGQSAPNFLTLPSFGSAAELSRAKAFESWYQMYLKYVQNSSYCGYMLEKIIFDIALSTERYHVLGSGPIYDANGLLIKHSDSEILYYQNKLIYAGEHGAGFDLFLIDKDSNIPIGIEAKNKREWLYPASEEVWRAIARACSLDCLPVIITRKISYIARAGFFAKFGILGFETHSQYFNQKIQTHSNYDFKDKIIHKDRLGFADIRLIKPKETLDPNMCNFFNKIIPENIDEYFKRFMSHKEILSRYAIEYKMGDKSMNQGARFKLYKEFMAELEEEDLEVPLKV